METDSTLIYLRIEQGQANGPSREETVALGPRPSFFFHRTPNEIDTDRCHGILTCQNIGPCPARILWARDRTSTIRDP